MAGLAVPTGAAPPAAATAEAPEVRHAVACRHHESVRPLLLTGRADEVEREFRQAFDIWDKLRVEWPASVNTVNTPLGPFTTSGGFVPPPRQLRKPSSVTAAR